METHLSIVQKIIDNGWRQGSVINVDSVPVLDSGRYILLSQDCDISHDCLEDEPNIEIISFMQIKPDELNGNFTHGKNPRRLQILLSDNKYYEFCAKDRRFVSRKQLATLLPDINLQMPESSLRVIKSWVSKRYDRAAFPFAFDERLKNRKKIIKFLEKNGKNVLGVFVRLNSSNELAESDPYLLYLVIIVDQEIDDYERAGLEKILEDLYVLFNANEGIQVLDDYRILTIKEISLDEFISLQKLDFDYISHRSNGGKFIQ